MIGFLLVGTAGSLGLVSADWKARAVTLSVTLMTTAMAAMGLSTPLGAMARRAGARTIYAGLAGFFALAAFVKSGGIT